MKKKNPEGLPFKVGDKIFIRTVTHYQVGKVVAIGRDFITLDPAAWVACTKRWADTLKTGELDEVEPFPSWCMVARGAIVDVAPWAHSLPKEQK